MVNAKLITASVATAIVVVPACTEAHSWVDCMDWKFTGSKQSFDDNAGTCAGYARRFPVQYSGDQVTPRYAFGSLDSADPNRHYMQSEQHPDDWPACSTGKPYKGGENEEVGSDETRASPVDEAYGQGKWGPMTVAKAGQQLCVRWPAKTHKDEPDNVVYINMPPTPLSQDPTQRQLNQWTIAKLDYGNCFSGGSDKARCGGCFTIPQNRNPGDYLIQWRWKLNGSDNIPEWYTSCSDVRITDGQGGDAPASSAESSTTASQKGGKATLTPTPTPTPTPTQTDDADSSAGPTTTSKGRGNMTTPTTTNDDGDMNSKHQNSSSKSTITQDDDTSKSSTTIGSDIIKPSATSTLGDDKDDPEEKEFENGKNNSYRELKRSVVVSRSQYRLRRRFRSLLNHRV